MIERPYLWTNVLLLALGTFAIRGSIVAISSRVPIPERARELFSFIPAAILPAFFAPAVFFHRGQIEWAGGKERLLVLTLATVVCSLSRSTTATLATGLIALYALSATT